MASSISKWIIYVASVALATKQGFFLSDAKGREAPIGIDTVRPENEWRMARIYRMRGELQLCFESADGSPWMSCLRVKPTTSFRQCIDPGRGEQFICSNLPGA